jgi:hypothetical protein
MQVAKDQRSGEAPARSQRVAGAGLEVHVPRLVRAGRRAWSWCSDALEGFVRAISEDDGETLARQEEAVPAAAAGEVHDGAARRGIGQRTEMLVEQRRVH